MSFRRSVHARRLVALPAVAALVAAGLAAAQGTAGAAGTTGAGGARTATASSVTSTATQHGTVRHITRRKSTTRFPKPATVSSHGRALNLSEDGQLTRYGARSASPRPTIATRNGANLRTGSSTALSPATSWVPVVRPTAVSTTRPRVLRSWRGLNEVDNDQTLGFSFEPPDQGLCVGAGHVLETINVSVRVYDTDGTPAAAPVSINQFFQYPPLLNFDTGVWGPELTDPSCVFDAGTQRFYVTTLILELDPKTGNLTLANHVDIAVSKTSNPLKGWLFYTIPTTDTGGPNGPKHKDCPCVGDFPHLGTDANGLYITTNEYPWSSDPGVFGNNFNGAQVYAMSKRALATGVSTLTVVHFQNTHVTDDGQVRPGFAITPALSVGTRYPTAKNGSEYFTSSFAAEEARPTGFTGHADEVALWQITNTSSLDSDAPALTLHAYVVESEIYGVPPLSNQKTGPTPLLDCLRVQCRGDGSPYTSDVENGLDSSDSRTLTAWFVNGKVLTALDTVMIVSSNVQAGLAWFALDAKGSSSAMAKQGYLGVTNQNVTYPAIATTPSGSGVVGMTLSGDNYYPSAAYAFFTAWGGPGTVHTAKLGAGPEDGFCEYDFFDCAGTELPQARPRWGDYGAAAWDGHHLWVANEYIAQRCSFAQFDADTTCGGTRTYYGNFSTRITKLSTS